MKKRPDQAGGISTGSAVRFDMGQDNEMIWEGDAMYQKEIIYMGLYKDGIRMGSAGFLKVENKGRESSLYMKAQNVPQGISGKYPVRIYCGSGWKEMDGVTFAEGRGSWQSDVQERADRAVVQVILPGGYMLSGRSKSAPENMLVKDVDVAVHADRTMQEQTPGRLGEIGYKVAEERTDRKRPEGVQRSARSEASEDTQGSAESITRESTAPGKIRESAESAEPGRIWENAEHVISEGVQNIMQEDKFAYPEKTAQKEVKERKEKRTAPQTILITEELPRRSTESALDGSETIPACHVKEDKWEQILDTFEKIHPYGDERVYIKLEPKDFVILQSKYQHLVNNSFLLHGFYNYRYIILGKEDDFYLGVPGVFYEREKMVALMFGFEAFECPGGNVKAGEFGYYLRKVEL